MKAQTKVLLLMVTALVVILLYAIVPIEIVAGSLRLKKIHLASVLPKTEKPTVKVKKKRKVVRKHQTILFFGDSMVEGLSRRFGDYAGKNGHTLYTVIWYSSSTERWATTNTLEHFIAEYRPTYLVLCLGSNELFVNDLDQREQYIRRLVKKMGNLPFVWISPADWNGDTGIVNLMKKECGEDRFYDSRHLKLERGSDHYHPTWKASAYWMDQAAVYMASKKNAAPLYLNYPTKHSKAANTKLLSPSFEGY